MFPQNSDVAFTIVVNRQADDDEAGEGDEEEDPDNTNNNRMEVDFVQEAVQEAIQEAVQDAVQEVCKHKQTHQALSLRANRQSSVYANSCSRGIAPE